MRVQLENSFLVVIDIQQRLAAAMPSDDRERVIRQNCLLIQAANTLTVPLIITEQYPKGLGATVDALTACVDEPLPCIEKLCFSCTQSETFMTRLRASHARQVILTGMEAHICVLQTALSLHEQGFQVFVVEDAVCSRQQAHAVNAMHRLRAAGVIVTNAESVMFEWLETASHPHFKTLSRLLGSR